MRNFILNNFEVIMKGIALFTIVTLWLVCFAIPFSVLIFYLIINLLAI